MKNLALVVCDFCAAAVGLVVWSPARTRSVNELARRLEVVRTDSRTVV
jgi:hypothetical protein